ncbi:MAG: ATP-binding protein, partial [Candidatus Nanoarchaeia archaeon]
EGEISKTIIDFVKENRESVLSVDSKSAGTGARNGKSTMCIPMLVNQQLTGMIYYENFGSHCFDEDDLSLATVITHSAALAIENIRLLEFNLKNERLVATGTTAAGLSHYIKNILAGLDGSLNLLKMAIEEKDLNMADESLAILSKNHKRLGNLVLDLLNLTSEQKLNLKINDLNAVINDVMELMVPQLKQQGIELRKNPVISQLPLYAEFDAVGMHRVLLNLILNSEHAIQSKMETLDTPHSGIIYINAGFSETKDYIVVSVTDNGIGLDEKDASKIFEIFFTSKGSAGTGLGLAVTKRIIDAHGGTISATGKKGESCTISFTIPVMHNESNTMTHAIKRMVQ